MSVTSLASLFAYKAWSNAELFALLRSVPADQGEALKGCIRTLNHIHVVDRLFRAYLTGEPRPFAATNTPATPTLAALHAAVSDTDAWYVAYSAQLDAAAQAEVVDFSFTDGDAGRMSREEMLLHIITHGAYHRGNVGQMLRAIGMAPPRDLYTRFLHASEPARRGGEAAV